jgi:hypothetical protein
MELTYFHVRSKVEIGTGNKSIIISIDTSRISSRPISQIMYNIQRYHGTMNPPLLQMFRERESYNFQMNVSQYGVKFCSSFSKHVMTRISLMTCGSEVHNHLFSLNISLQLIQKGS